MAFKIPEFLYGPHLETAANQNFPVLLEQARKLRHDFLVCARNPAGQNIFETVSAPGKSLGSFFAEALDNFSAHGKRVWNVYSLNGEIPKSIITQIISYETANARQTHEIKF